MKRGRVKVDGAEYRGWYWKLVGSNGRTLGHSEQYSSKAKAVQTAKRVAAAIGWPVV